MLVPFVLAKEIEYSVGVGVHDRGGWGSGGIPHAYLVAPDGTVAWEGHPARLQDDRIQSLLREAEEFPLEETAPEVRAAADAYRKGKLTKAEQLAEETRHPDGEHIARRIGALRKVWKGQVEKAIAAGAYEDAAEVCARLKKHFARGEAAEWASAQEKKLRSDPEIKKDKRARRAFGRIAEEFVSLRRNDEKGREALIKQVRRFVKRHEGTRTAALARSVQAKLENP